MIIYNIKMTDNTENASTQPETLSLEDQFSEINTQLSSLNSNVRGLQTRLKTLSRDVKAAEKKSRHKPKAPPKPMVIDKKLATFIKVSNSDHITKAEVMKHISSYIKSNNLQNESDKRQFTPNKQLTKLFGLSEPKSMTFVEINKYISQYLSPVSA